MAQKFVSRPVLNAAFITENPPISRVSAVNTSLTNQFILILSLTLRWRVLCLCILFLVLLITFKVMPCLFLGLLLLCQSNRQGIYYFIVYPVVLFNSGASTCVFCPSVRKSVNSFPVAITIAPTYI